MFVDGGCDLCSVLFMQAQSHLERIRKLPLALVGGDEVMDDVNGILGIVNGLADGDGPKAIQVSIYSQFFKTCLKQMENFVVLPMLANNSKVPSTP